jgi:hypothetical protein
VAKSLDATQSAGTETSSAPPHDSKTPG